jgi:hypothetical protein
MSSQLLHAIRRYCKERKVAPSTFGRAAVNDPRLVSDLQRGQQVGERRAARIRAFMCGEAPPRPLPKLAERQASPPAAPEPARVAPLAPALVAAQYEPAPRRQRTGRYTTRSNDPHPVLGDIARFLRDTGMRETTFGYRALGDFNFVEDVRCGRDVRRATERTLRAFMQEAAR